LRIISTQTGHFLLTNLLLEKMKSTAESTAIEGRIVNLSSIAHHHTYEEGIIFYQLNDPTVYATSQFTTVTGRFQFW
jgi:retinol dehydrogenase 12